MARRKLPALSRSAQHTLTKVAGVAALVTLFVLAASVSNLTVKPGEQFILPERPLIESSPTALPAFPQEILQAMLILFAILLVASLILLIRSPAHRRIVLKRLGQLLFFVALYALLSFFSQQEQPAEMEQVVEPPTFSQPGEQQPTTPVPASPVAFTPPAWDNRTGYVVSLVIVLAGAAIAYGAWRLTRVPAQQVHKIASTALDRLAAGQAWDDVVVRCYADMNTTISRWRGVHRHQAMTPREFALRLEQIGLPRDAIRDLTSLFEKARYGGRSSTTGEAQRAIDCLTAIVQAMENQS